MSTTVSNYLCSRLCDTTLIDAELLLTTFFYLETYKQGSTIGPDGELEELLKEEDFTEAPIELIKQYLIDFASSTKSTPLLVSAISALRVLKDKTLKPLITTWLYTHLKQTLDHQSVMFQLLLAADELNKGVIPRSSYGTSDIDENIKDARAYILKELGIHVPG